MELLLGLLALWLCMGLFCTLLVLVVFLCEKRTTDWGVLVLPLFGPLVFIGFVALILKSNATLSGNGQQKGQYERHT